MNIQELPVKKIYPDPDFNCRGQIAPIDVMELVKSIEKNGLQQPVVVQPYKKDGYDWRLVMGHRRHKAFEMLKRETIPSVVRENLTEIEARKLNLIENLERCDLTIMQEAQALKRLFDLGVSNVAVAKLLNKSIGWVNIREIALRLPSPIQHEINAGFITQQQIRDLAKLDSSDSQFEAVRNILDRRLRNEKAEINIFGNKPKKPNLNKKEPRNLVEIFKMQDIIQEVVGNNFGTRCLAWTGGMISDMELYQDLHEVAFEKGIHYEVPTV